MNPKLRYALVVAIIAFCAGLAGAWVGRTYLPAPLPRAELHDFLHNHLDLDAGQRARLEALESRFAVKKNVLEARLKAHNAELAAAIDREHGEGPQVAAAVDRSHQTMGELQKATLAHVFAMRALMRPDQATRFDAAVIRALTTEGQ
ncbi:MAG: periplasmic heavy metal sensor [Sandarakinorhabdus sp.]|nr:periplasmic heavy metal sensor [Sandarakinorhabdus sp.]